MTLQLYFNPAKFPRTITRNEWKEIWRWKRIAAQQCEKELQEQILRLRVFGSDWPEQVRADIMDRIVNPPLLIHDKQTFP